MRAKGPAASDKGDQSLPHGADQHESTSQDKNRLANHGGGISIVGRGVVVVKHLFPNKWLRKEVRGIDRTMYVLDPEISVRACVSLLIWNGSI